MNNQYFETIIRIENIHRLFLNVLKDNLMQCEINNVSAIEAILIYNIGKEKKQIARACEVGYNIGTNFTYSISKLEKNRYVIKENDTYDTRIKFVRLSNKGLELLEIIEGIINSQAQQLLSEGINDKGIADHNNFLEGLENVLSLQKYNI